MKKLMTRALLFLGLSLLMGVALGQTLYHDSAESVSLELQGAEAELEEDNCFELLVTPLHIDLPEVAITTVPDLLTGHPEWQPYVDCVLTQGVVHHAPLRGPPTIG